MITANKATKINLKQTFAANEVTKINLKTNSQLAHQITHQIKSLKPTLTNTYNWQQNRFKLYNKTK